MIRVPSPAKLNLFLHITGRRDNGYHELQSIFQLIDLQDWLEFRPKNDDISISIEGINTVDIEQNLIYKAIQVLKPYAQKEIGLSILVEKNIPYISNTQINQNLISKNSTVALRVPSEEKE